MCARSLATIDFVLLPYKNKNYIDCENANIFVPVKGDSDDEIIEDEADGPEMRTVSIRQIGSCNRIRVCILKNHRLKPPAKAF